MIKTRPYLEPAKDKIADYQNICARKEAIVSVISAAGRWMVRRHWYNAHGGGTTDLNLLPKQEVFFTHEGTFLISLADWEMLTDKSLNQKKATTKVALHEWKFPEVKGSLVHHTVPIVKAGDTVTIIYPIRQSGPLTVLVRTPLGKRVVVYFSQLVCPSDEKITTQNGA